MLKRVVVCDSENQGKICMEEEDIVECRTRSSHLDKDTNKHPIIVAWCCMCPSWICPWSMDTQWSRRYLLCSLQIISKRRIVSKKPSKFIKMMKTSGRFSVKLFMFLPNSLDLWWWGMEDLWWRKRHVHVHYSLAMNIFIL